MCVAGVVVAYGALSLFDRKIHLVQIEWNKVGVEHVAVFRIDSVHFGPFLAEVERVTGKESEDIWAVREKFLQRQWGHIDSQEEDANTKLQKEPEQGEANAWPNRPDGNLEQGSSSIARCQVLATDSDEYRENCAAGQRQGIRSQITSALVTRDALKTVATSAVGIQAANGPDSQERQPEQKRR